METPSVRMWPAISGYTDVRIFMKYGIEVLYKHFRAISSSVKKKKTAVSEVRL